MPGIPFLAPHQVGFDESVQIPVEYQIRVIDGELRPVILDTPVIQDITPDLAAPFVFHLIRFHPVAFGVAFFDLLFVKPRFEHLQRLIPVLMLGAFLLAFDHDAGRDMAYTHGRFGFVDVLTSGAARPEGIPLEIIGPDLYFDTVIDQWVHEDGGKGGHPLPLGVEWTDAHEAMYPIFSFEHAVGILPVDLNLRAFDTGDIACLAVEFGNFIPVFLAPHEIHAKEHLGPVTTFRSAGTGIDLQDTGQFILRMIECAAEFNVVDELYRFFIGCIQFFFGRLPRIKKLEEDAEIVDDSFDFFKMGDPVLMDLDFLQGSLGALTV